MGVVATHTPKGIGALKPNQNCFFSDQLLSRNHSFIIFLLGLNLPPPSSHNYIYETRCARGIIFIIQLRLVKQANIIHNVFIIHSVLIIHNILRVLEQTKEVINYCGVITSLLQQI